MKRLTTLAAIVLASPALAHVDGQFHSHGVENALVLALIAAGVAFFAFKR